MILSTPCLSYQRYEHCTVVDIIYRYLYTCTSVLCIFKRATAQYVQYTRQAVQALNTAFAREIKSV